MRLKWNRKTLALTAGILAAVAILGVAGTQLYIRWEVAFTGDQAARAFGGGRVDALAKLVECRECPLSQRNRAVWALGEMGDTSVLEVLRKHHTGERCDHRHALCQHELEKAIGKIQRTWGLLPQIDRLRAAL
jgi:HEAT repeat protein